MLEGNNLANTAELRIMNALDKAVNLLGQQLSQEARAFIGLFAVEPSLPTWRTARSIIISSEPVVTIWSAVAQANPALAASSAVPTVEEVACALEQTV